jgi:hypothetical protein
LIRLAANECDRVIVFVSTSDRNRPGELPISGTTMNTIWRMHIEPTLPSNVEVVYGGSPIAHVKDALISADDDGARLTYAVYGDTNDIALNFPVGHRSARSAETEKYAPNLVSSGRFIPRGVSRESTINVSGTAMREFLKNNDKASFVANLPKTLDADGIWDALKTTTTEPHKMFRVKTALGKKKTSKKSVAVENALREYINLIVRG